MKRILSLLIVLLMSGSVFAQSPFMGPQPMNGQSSDRRDRDNGESIRTRVRIRVVVELIEHLELTEDQTEQLFPVLRSFYESRDELTDKRQELIRQLTGSIDDGSIDDTSADTDEFMKQAEEIETLSKKLLDLRADLLKRTKKILNERQYIKLAMFDERLNQALMDMYRIPRPFGQFNSNDNNNNNPR